MTALSHTPRYFNFGKRKSDNSNKSIISENFKQLTQEKKEKKKYFLTGD